VANQVKKELVLMARKHFESKGEYPTEEKIRKFIGFGSATTINRLNNEILAEKRLEALNRSVHMPSELPALWMATAANKADEMTAVITAQLEEKGLSLQEAVNQLEELREQKSEMEGQVKVMQINHLELNETLLKERTAREATESSLRATITEQTKALGKVTSGRDELLEKNQQLMIESARHEEATSHQTMEINRLETSVNRVQDELQAERGKTAVALEKIEWLTKSLNERTDEVKRSFDMEHNMLEQFAILKESLLSSKTSVKTTKTDRSNGAPKPQANA